MIELNIRAEDKFGMDWIGKEGDPYTICFTIGGITFKSPKMARKEAEAMKEAIWGLTRHECQHPKVIPTFDEDAAKDLGTEEIRKHWPRFFGKCPDCDFNGIMYASYAHYIFGDW